MTEKGLGWGHLKPVSDAFNRAMAAPEAPAGFAGQFVLTAVKGRYYESWYCVSSKDCSATAAGLKCPHCGKKILETDKGFFCEDRDFKCWKSTRGAKISREELQKILEGQGDELDFVGKSSGKPYKGRLVLNEAKDGLDFEFADKKDGLSGSELTDIARDGGSGAGEGQ